MGELNCDSARQLVEKNAEPHSVSSDQYMPGNAGVCVHSHGPMMTLCCFLEYRKKTY
jgi:hypothetical protein